MSAPTTRDECRHWGARVLRGVRVSHVLRVKHHDAELGRLRLSRGVTRVRLDNHRGADQGGDEHEEPQGEHDRRREGRVAAAPRATARMAAGTHSRHLMCSCAHPALFLH